ncbi:MAG: hypothetical protein P8L68_15040 [Paracoccaceae bacterium]|nr:hypothetical protein [Paracoccaceae bacterium]MDG1738457.1 hypothetical protein [Paracoccaceae bacterium]MDG2259796.1 hypothetical protein [Paracoccaceae bacterium]
MSDNDIEKKAADSVTEADVEEVQIEDAIVVEVEADDADPTPEPEIPDETQDVEPKQELAKPAAKSSGLVSLLAGGVIAGAIGFGAATYLNLGGSSQSDALIAELSSQVAAQSEAIDRLAAEVLRVEGLSDTTHITDQIDQLSAELETIMSDRLAALPSQLDALSTSVVALETRLLDVEKRPMAEAISADAVNAYEAEMAALRAAIANHRTDIEAMAADARAMEASAKAEAIKTEGTSWLTDISVAIANGASFAEPLNALAAEGVEIPDALTQFAESGLVTQSELVEQFPDAARLALNAVRTAETEGEATGGIMTFLQNQLGVRSISPRDGDSADAILSRAEAAVKSGDIETAISELAFLPESGATAMAEWVAHAHQRVAALAGRDALKEQIENR